jgi:hypothetical protein
MTVEEPAMIVIGWDGRTWAWWPDNTLITVAEWMNATVRK